MFRVIMDSLSMKDRDMTEPGSARHYLALNGTEEKDEGTLYIDEAVGHSSRLSPHTHDDITALPHTNSRANSREAFDALPSTYREGYLRSMQVWLLHILISSKLGVQWMKHSCPQKASLTEYSRTSVVQFLLCLLPSFLIPRGRSEKVKKLHSTAWLDGLRGIAALLVVFHHSSLVWFSWEIHFGWTPGDSLQGTFFRLPIIRLLISGPPQVAIFFVLSGFAISYKAIKMARLRRFESAASALSSSVLRRHPRLFLPAATVTLINALAAYWYPHAWPTAGFPGVAQPVRPAPYAQNMTEQLWQYVDVQLHASKPLKQGLIEASDRALYNNPYDMNLWTLPVEWSSSMVVFGFLLAFMRVSTRVRILALVIVMCYLQWFFVYWGIFLFFGGMLACEMHFEINGVSGTSKDANLANKESSEDESALPRWAHDAQRNPFKHCISSMRSVSSLAGFFISLWLLSTPELVRGASTAYGFRTLLSWAPPHMGDFFLVPIGAILLVIFVDLGGTRLQFLFTNPFSQYLARISFSLYLVHGPMLWSIGLRLSTWSVKRMSGGKPMITTGPEYFWGIVIGQCLWWPIVIWAADITARLVDENVVRFTRWAYGKVEMKLD